MPRGALAALFLAAACGGGTAPAQRAARPETPGPVLRPDVPPPPAGADNEPPEPAHAGSVEEEPSADVMTARPGPKFGDEPLPAVTPQPPAKGCDAEPFVAEGRDKIAMGAPAQALAAFEKALVCVHDPGIEKYAVLAACQAKLYSRARAHFIRVADGDRNALAQICAGPQF